MSGPNDSRWRDDELIMISALEHWSYCPRQCALIHLEQTFDENLYTLRGRIVHERVDHAKGDTQAGVRVERGLPLWSRRLGLVGKADVVEFRVQESKSQKVQEIGQVEKSKSQKVEKPDRVAESEGQKAEPPMPSCSSTLPHFDSSTSFGIPYPVEYKHGKKRRWVHEDLQLCAQAMCLEEMTGIDVPQGAIFYHSSRRRKPVCFSDALRQEVEDAVAAIRQMLDSSRLPPAVNDARCTHCSLKESCMPAVVAEQHRWAAVERTLFCAE